MAKQDAAPKSQERGRAEKTPPLRRVQSRGVKAQPPELDRLIHERVRLGIVSALAVSERLSFNDLKRLLRASDGNLSVHARKLEEARYVLCTKQFQGRLPKTEYQLTDLGRQALQKYLAHMEALIQSIRER